MEEEKRSSAASESSLPESAPTSAGGNVSVQSAAPDRGSGYSGPAEPRRSRLKIFNKLMEKSLQRLVADAGFNRFCHSFHPLCKQNPQMAEVIHKQFISDLQKSIQDEISSMIEEGNLEVKLEELDKLEELARVTPEPAWRPSGIPEQDVCSALVSYHQGQEEYVRRELRKLQRENAALAEQVQAGREAISHSQQRISAAVEEWKASVADLESFVMSLCPSENFDSFESPVERISF